MDLQTNRFTAHTCLPQTAAKLHKAIYSFNYTFQLVFVICLID